MDIGPTELILILVIFIVLFGVGRISQLGSELGKAIRDFRQGLQDDTPRPDEPQPPDAHHNEKPDDPTANG